VEKKFWQGNPPTECDYCGDKLGYTFYDTVACGRWGYLCPSCNKSHGVTKGDNSRLGTGVGQKYAWSQPEGKFLKVA
jgi:hypothetical protein